MDGVSSMAITASATVNYGKQLFIPQKDVGLLERILLRVFTPFSAISLVSNLIGSRDDNALTQGKKHMTGIINCASYKSMDLSKIKALSKH
jgi:hypothetical protein